MKTILAIVQHRKGRSPGQRFRLEHYLKYLEEQNYKIIFSNIISEEDDKIFYSKANYFSKLKIVIKSFLHRLKDLKTAKSCDAIFIYREAFMLGTTYFEKRFSKLNIPVIFDFDDSIWLNDTSEGNKNLAWLKRPKKTAKICKYSDIVIAGNEFLAEYAKKYNSNVHVIPTAINTDYHKPLENGKNKPDKICIGWTGTSTTIKHYDLIIPYLKELKSRFGDKIYFKLIADIDKWDKDIEVELVKWKKETEISELSEFDIGIMPLPENNEWAKGKCGFKGLQCMAMEIPVVMSPVGVNNTIINNGSNGFLCKSKNEWISALSFLIRSSEARKEIGAEGRKTVENHYSVNRWKDDFLKLFPNEK